MLLLDVGSLNFKSHPKLDEMVAKYHGISSPSFSRKRKRKEKKRREIEKEKEKKKENILLSDTSLFFTERKKKGLESFLQRENVKEILEFEEMNKEKGEKEKKGEEENKNGEEEESGEERREGEEEIVDEKNISIFYDSFSLDVWSLQALMVKTNMDFEKVFFIFYFI